MSLSEVNSGAISIHLRTPLPVSVKGTALPVKVLDSRPIRTVNVGPPDTIALATLWVAVATLAASVLAALLTWRSILIAKRDLAITLEQASRVPNLVASVYNPQFGISEASWHGFGVVQNANLALRLENVGKKRTSDIILKIRTSDELRINYPDARVRSFVLDQNEHLSFVQFPDTSIAVTEHVDLPGWSISALPGNHTLYWQVSSLDGDWPCLSSDPLEHWGKIPVIVQLGGEPTQA